jgi:3-mercaptopyruvate sulfurtransferase SseA
MQPVIAPFVDAAWLAAHRRDVTVGDVRWYLDGRSGRAAYDAGHLPGAVFVDLDADLSAPPGTAGRHPLPSPEAFAAAMAARGIGDGDTVVAYDDEGGVIAARLVWMLRATGHEAALLDGGLAAWPWPLGTATTQRAPARFAPRPWPPELLAGSVCRRHAGRSSTPAAPSVRAASPTPTTARPHIPGARSVRHASTCAPTGACGTPPPCASASPPWGSSPARASSPTAAAA